MVTYTALHAPSTIRGLHALNSEAERSTRYMYGTSWALADTVSASVLGSFGFRQIAIPIAKMTKPIEEIAICL